MLVSDLETVGVIGAGQMGHGIAQVLSHMGGYAVKLYDTAPHALQSAQSAIEKNVSRLLAKGVVTEAEKTAVMDRITYETHLEALENADLIIEAIVENEAIKTALFRQLDHIAQPAAVLASNTSSISITRLASATSRPEQVIGMHFMNPVPVMKLVEIIRGAQSSEETCRMIQELTLKLGKTPVLSRDFPGFISNRVLMPLINEAIFALYEGVGGAEDIDTVFRLGMNHPMGPLALADFIGLDTVLSILNVLFEGFNDARFRPCPLLRQYVDAGYLGRKTGRGFFQYPKDK